MKSSRHIQALKSAWIGTLFFTVLVFFCASPSVAQFLPGTVEPERFDRRYEPPPIPKAAPLRAKPKKAKPKTPPKPEEIRFRVKKFEFEGVTRYTRRQLYSLYRAYLRKRITVSDIYALAEALTAKYRNDGYILSQAIVPPQKILNNGTVKLRVIEGFIHKVTFKGKAAGSTKLLRQYRDGILKSRPLNSEKLERYLLLLNDLPGVSARSIIKPSEEQEGASDLVIVLENKRFRAHGGLDNRGSSFNGPVQFNAGASVHSVLGLYERTSFQTVISAQTDELKYFQLSHDLPVTGEGTRFSISGSYADSQPGGGLEAFLIEGESTAFSFRFTHPFLRTRSKNVNAFMGFGLRNSNTDTLGITIAKDRIRYFEMGTTLDVADRFRGINVASVRMTQGLNFLDATEPGSGNLSREFGDSDFTRFDGELLRLQQIAPQWNFKASFAWQHSFSNLLASQEFSVGGPRFGRAYDPAEIVGDSGLSLLGELQYTHPFGKPWLKEMQPYLSFDYGAIWHKEDVNIENDFQDLYSLAMGVRANFTDRISGYMELAVPLDRRVSSEGDKDPRFFFGLTARY